MGKNPGISIFGVDERSGVDRRAPRDRRDGEERRSRVEGEQIKVTEGVFTFVAIDENGKPRPVPPE